MACISRARKTGKTPFGLYIIKRKEVWGRLRHQAKRIHVPHQHILALYCGWCFKWGWALSAPNKQQAGTCTCLKGGPINIKLISHLSNSDRREIQLNVLGPHKLSDNVTKSLPPLPPTDCLFRGAHLSLGVLAFGLDGGGTGRCMCMFGCVLDL